MAHADFPAYRGRMEYVCLDCGARHPGDSLLYTCPQCGGGIGAGPFTIGVNQRLVRHGRKQDRVGQPLAKQG